MGVVARASRISFASLKAQGEIAIQMELILWFDCGAIVPWVRKINGHLRAIAGPDALSSGRPRPLRKGFRDPSRLTARNLAREQGPAEERKK